jgi:hypothetical protein
MKLESFAVAAFLLVVFAGPLSAEENAPSDAQVAPKKWEVARVRCSDLLHASDEDRASAVMFYYGYLAAKANIRVIDTSKIESNVGKVMKQCEAVPTMTMPAAFRQALKRPQKK